MNEPGDDVPDMGSITALESKGNYRQYNALSEDIDKLPTYVSFGSSCYIIDTTDLYKFDGDRHPNIEGMKQIKEQLINFLLRG